MPDVDAKFPAGLSCSYLIGVSTGELIHKGGRQVSHDERQVLATVERMTAAFQNGDIENVMKVYENDAVVVFEPERPLSDPAVVRATFKQWFAMSPRFEYAGHDVLVAGDLAVHIAPWKMRGKAADGAPIEQSGLSVAVLRRQSDGRWLMVIDNPHGQHVPQPAAVNR